MMAAAHMTEREKLQGRLHAAKVNGGAAVATPRGGNRFTVEGRTGARYTVWVIGDRYVCDCKAGQFGNACWHAGAAFMRILADRAVAA